MLTEIVQILSENDSQLFKPPALKKKKENLKSEKLIQKEAALRVTKLEQSIQQQTELHEIKKAAALQEKEYWRIRTELLKN